MRNVAGSQINLNWNLVNKIYVFIDFSFLNKLMKSIAF